ncbi:MAG: HDIG domain-containing metalloprotein [Candidatus Helarchaeota archaeon]
MDIDSLTRSTALSLLQQIGLPKHIIQHSIAVAEKALAIAQQLIDAGHSVNLKIVEIGALLHDIGRIEAKGLPHASRGGHILRSYNYPDSIARIAETHSLNPTHPSTLEEKIVYYTDKIIKGTTEISVDLRFAQWANRYGTTPLLQAAKALVLQIEHELSILLGKPLSNA